MNAAKVKFTRKTWSPIAAVVAVILIIVLVVSLYIVQNQRIANVRAADVANKATSAKELAKADARYNDLFNNYSQLYKQLKDNSVTPSAPNPDVISQPGATGSTGPTGAQGPGPSDSQVLSGVGSFCTMHPTACVGSAGTNGTNGQDGTQGPIGPAGPQGTSGVNGTNGTNGTNGVGIASVSCVLEADMVTTAFQFTFTDGTTQDVAGSCIPN